MRFYQEPHSFYCGIDLHARTMHLCILDQAGHTVLDKSHPCRPEALLRAISGGKKLDTGGKKIGKAHLRWAFAEAACLLLRSSEQAKRWKAAQRGEGTALAILAARLGRAVYHVLRKGEAFDEERFRGGVRPSGTGSSCLSRQEVPDRR